MPETKPPFRPDDRVHHSPTGETWVVAYADPETGRLSWCGWPEGEAQTSDCTLVRAASDEASAALRAGLIAAGGRRGATVARLYPDGPTSETPQLPSSTPGEVERLVDALIAAAKRIATERISGEVGGVFAASNKLKIARTALLSHISTAGRGEGAGDLAGDDQTARFIAESDALERQKRALVAAERAYREAFDAYASLHLTALRHRVAMRAALSAADATNPQDQE